MHVAANSENSVGAETARKRGRPLPFISIYIDFAIAIPWLLHTSFYKPGFGKAAEPPQYFRVGWPDFTAETHNY